MKSARVNFLRWIIGLAFVFVVFVSGCTDQVRDLNDSGDLEDGDALNDEIMRFRGESCGNGVCEFYRLSLDEGSGGGAIFLDDEYHAVVLKDVYSGERARICVDGVCGDAGLRNTTNIGDVYVFAEDIVYSRQAGASRVTLGFGENGNTCSVDCNGISGYCGDGVCNARKVMLEVGDDENVIVDGAAVKVRLLSLENDIYEFEIAGPGEIKVTSLGRGVGRGGVGHSIPLADIHAVRGIMTTADMSKMISIGYAVSDISREAVTMYLGDEVVGDEICADCRDELTGL